MKTLTIRGIDPALADAIRSLAAKNEESINQTALNILRKATGVGTKPIFNKHHDLDTLAGTWSEEDERDFNRAVEAFDKIDQELWG